jgi:hypothetical protein
MSAPQNSSVEHGPNTAGKPVLVTLAATAKTVGCSRHRVQSALACGDVEPTAFLDLDGRLQPLFTPNAAIVLLALIRGGSPIRHDPMPPIFTSTQS